MNKTFEVAKYEYTRHVSKKSFWVGLFALPLGLLLLIGLSTLLSVSSIDKTPIGYVDQSGLITLEPEVVDSGDLFSEDIQLVAFDSVEAAAQAAGAGQIQAYVVIPENFLSSYKLDYRYNQPFNDSIRSDISDFIRINLMADDSVPNLQRIQTSPEFISQSLDGTKTGSPNDFVTIFMPVIIGVLFFFVVIMSGSYLLQAVVEEKENRTMEVMVTSVSHNQLMAGKILGNISVGLTQLILWAIVAFGLVLIFRDRVAFLFELKLSLKDIVIPVLLLTPAFVFTAALMATLGATVTDTEESSQVSGIVILPMTIPYYFMATFMQNPNGVLAKALSYFPMSSPVATTLRMAFSNVPTIEIIAIFISQVLFAIFSVWLAGKAFRRGMLNYSKRLKLKDIFSKEVENA
ncbi:MAG: ABC transporter permease [Anaerolineaceae bacterium]